MPDRAAKDSEEIQQAFLDHERLVRVDNFRIACLTALVFMPAGWSLDLFVYPDFKWKFLLLRLLCSALLWFIWWFITTTFGSKCERLLGLILPGLPAFFISLMIYLKEGADSPYYAGLNLVLLGAVIILRWSVTESAMILMMVIGVYLAACLLHGAITKEIWRTFYNNIYFLVVTGAFIVIGSHFYNRLRFREFALRFELDKNKKALEQQNSALAAANRQIKEAESHLVQSEKLASLGRMSAGIIHEINNPLNFVKTGLYTLKKKSGQISADQRADYEDILKDVEDGFNRVATIVSSLRGFTHHDDESRDDVPVTALVDESLRFVSHEWSTGVQLRKQLAEGQVIHANKNKLIQVCLNLLENSLDALKTKQFAAGEQPTISITSRVENGKSLLVFRDNGPGIPPENIGKIFDPFFTTKDVGDGMGMGLSICYRIVQEFQGDIRCASKPGQFCEFTLEFPAKE